MRGSLDSHRFRWGEASTGPRIAPLNPCSVHFDASLPAVSSVCMLMCGGDAWVVAAPMDLEWQEPKGVHYQELVRGAARPPALGLHHYMVISKNKFSSLLCVYDPPAP